MAQLKRGLEKVLMGNVAGDGGMGLVLTEVGHTEQGSLTVDETDPTTQDFYIEEQDDPVDSETTQAGSKRITWGTNNVEPAQLVRVLGGTYTPGLGANRIATLGTPTGGSGYTNGSYPATPLTGGTGTGATADITVAGGIVTVVAIVNRGSGYTANDDLSADTAVIGNGTGFTINVDAITATAVVERWDAPDTAPTIYQSLQFHWRNGGYVQYPYAKITAKTDFSFTRTALSKLTITAQILKPPKNGVPIQSVFPNG